MELSGTHLYVGAGSETGSHDHGVVLQPFDVMEDVKICNRAPILCTLCGSYLSIYAVLNIASDEWKCPFCRKINKPFHINATGVGDAASKRRQMSEIFLELQSQSAEFHESGTDNFGGVRSTHHDGSSIYVFALDSSLCDDPQLGNLLCAGLQSLAPFTRIAIIIYSKSINILRLCSMKNSFPLTSDTLSGEVDQVHSMAHLLSHGIHVITSALAVQNIELIVSCLESFAASSSLLNSRCRSHKGTQGSSKRSSPVCCANILLNLAVSLGGKKGPGVRLLVVSNRPLPIKPISSLDSSVDRTNDGNPNIITAYTKLGREACVRGCWIDIFHVGAESSHFDKLDALAGATGGYLIVAESLGDTHLERSFVKVVSNSSRVLAMATGQESGAETKSDKELRRQNGAHEVNVHLPMKGTFASVEIRTSENICVERIVGPVFSAEDALILTNNFSAERKASAASPAKENDSMCVDVEHVAFTLGCMDTCVAAAYTYGVGAAALSPTATSTSSTKGSPYKGSHTYGISSGSNALTNKYIDEAQTVYQNLVKLADDNVVVCACSRVEPATQLTVHLQHRMTESTGLASLWATSARSTGSPSLQSSAIAGAAAGDGERGSSDENEDLEQYAYVQCVVRYISAVDGTKVPWRPRHLF